MSFNVENLVRSAVVLVVGLPLTLSVTNLANTTSQLAASGLTPASKAQNGVKAELAEPCLRYMLSKADSKLEREAKTDIDEVFGGEVEYGATCKWAL